MLAPDLNGGMAAGTDCVDVNAHLYGTRKDHGANQGLMRVNGRDCGTSQAHLETQEEKACGNPTELQGKQQTHLGATSPRNQRKNSQRFQADRA